MASNSKIIVIGSTARTGNWLANCLLTLANFSKYPVIAVINDDFELGKLKWAYDNTKADDIFLMHDTVEVKDASIFDTIFSYSGSVAITNEPCPFGMFFGKYERRVLNRLEIPTTKTKLEAVEQEMEFNTKYASLAGDYLVICPELRNQQVFEEKFGRTNMILENRYFKKYKGTWSRSQL